MLAFRYRLMLSLGVFLSGLLPSSFVRGDVPDADHDWPQWRGPNRDGVALDQGLIKKWPEDGPPLLYCFKGDAKGVGDGHCPPIIVGNRAYISGKFNEDACLMAFELPENLPPPAPAGTGSDNLPMAGKLLWRTKFGKSCNSGENSSPTVVGNRIYLTSGNGEIAGFDTSGKLLWVHSMKTDFDARIQTNGGYGFSESPLVDGDKVIVCPGVSEAVMVAYDKETGKLIWKAENPEGKEKDPASHCSVMISHACGIKQYVNNTGWGLIGVSENGKFLWGHKKWAESRLQHAHRPRRLRLWRQRLRVSAYPVEADVRRRGRDHAQGGLFPQLRAMPVSLRPGGIDRRLRLRGPRAIRRDAAVHRFPHRQADVAGQADRQRRSGPDFLRRDADLPQRIEGGVARGGHAQGLQPGEQVQARQCARRLFPAGRGTRPAVSA